jgi:hypothetical protein
VLAGFERDGDDDDHEADGGLSAVQASSCLPGFVAIVATLGARPQAMARSC